MRRRMNFGGGDPPPPSLVGVMILLDRSGSMERVKTDMERAFDEFVRDQRAVQPEGLWLTLHQFDGSGYDVVYDRTPITRVGGLDLRPRGSTPLRDALWRFCGAARAVIDDANDPTERLLLVIITDGKDEDSAQTRKWAEVREQYEGLQSVDVESIWIGTSAAIMEAVEQMPTFALAGATVSNTATPTGVHYGARGMGVAAHAMRAGNSARGMTASYTSAGEREVTDEEYASWCNTARTRSTT